MWMHVAQIRPAMPLFSTKPLKMDSMFSFVVKVNYKYLFFFCLLFKQWKMKKILKPFVNKLYQIGVELQL